MSLKIILLSGFLFSSIYPLCFWLHAFTPLREKFHKYHLRLTNFISGIVVVIAIFMDLPVSLKIFILVWKIVLLNISLLYWKKKYPNLFIMSIPCIIGITAFFFIHDNCIISSSAVLVLELLLGSAFCFFVFYINRTKEYASLHTSHKRKRTNN